MTATAGRVAAPVLPAGWSLVALDSIDSTNEEAKRLADAGGRGPVMVWARRQESGRARRGRRWVSPAGNLYCSLLLRPQCRLDEAACAGFLAALAIMDALSGLSASLDLRLKWPNDVLIGGRKVSGILVEAAAQPSGMLDWLIIGAGINIVSHPEATETPATALAAEGVACDPAALLEFYAAHLAGWLNRWRTDGFSTIREAWLSRAHGLGAPVAVRLDRETLTGRFEDLDRDGGLLLRLADGTLRRIAAGDVFFGAAPTGS